MRISRIATNPHPYLLDGKFLEAVTSYKYLGLHITNDLSWNLHINYITNKANRMLGYVRRNFHSAPSSVKLLLFQTLVRSQLDYASSIWDPSTEVLSNQLEMIQNNAARFILSNYQRAASVSMMKTNLNLPSLTSRRKIARLCLFHKIFSHSTLHHALLPPPSYVSSRLDHLHKVGIPTCNTKAFFHSFIPRTSREWNHLPSDVATISNQDLFRSAVCNIIT